MNPTASGTLASLLESIILSVIGQGKKKTHKIPIDISVATPMLVGFSQVLLALLLLQVAVDEDESDVLEEDRPTTRLGKRFHAPFISSSARATTLLPIGTRGPTIWPLRRAIISSMLMSFDFPLLKIIRSVVLVDAMESI